MVIDDESQPQAKQLATPATATSEIVFDMSVQIYPQEERYCLTPT